MSQVATLGSVDVRLPPFLQPHRNIERSLHTEVWQRPSVGKQIAKGTALVAGTTWDAMFGTVWSVTEFVQAQKNLHKLRVGRAELAAYAQGLPTLPQASSTHRAAALKNCRAEMLSNRYARARQHVQWSMHGVAGGIGGLAYGVGWFITPSFLGLGYFSGYPAALVAAATTVLWVGGPLVSVAAGGVAIYESVRLWRHGRLRPLLEQVRENPVVGNEEQVYAVLQQRWRRVRDHGIIKTAAMLGIAAGAPLLVVGFAPGMGVLIPASIAAAYATYYFHHKLVYEPQLTVAERIHLGGQRDIINRIDLAHAEWAELKELKNSKRLLYPHGAQGWLSPLARAGGAMRRWAHGPLDYEPAHHTVMRFLRAHNGLQQRFIAQQLQVNAYEAGKAPDFARAQELMQLDMRLLAGRQSLQQEQALLGDSDAPWPNAQAAALHFLNYVERMNVHQAILKSSKSDPARKVFEAHDLFEHGGGHTTLNVLRWRRLLTQPDTGALAEHTNAFAERYLLTHGKRKAHDLRDELSDFMFRRLEAGASHA